MVQSCGGVQLILVGQELCDVVLKKVMCSMYTPTSKVLLCGTNEWYWFNVYFYALCLAVWFKELELVPRILQCPNFRSVIQRNGMGSMYTCRSRVLRCGTKKSLDSMYTLMSSVLQCGTKWWWGST